jgi:hypothetical protein
MEEINCESVGIATTDIATNLIDPGVKAFRCIKAVHVVPGFKQRLLHNIINGVRSHTSCSSDARETQICGRKLPISVSEKRFLESLLFACNIPSC